MRSLYLTLTILFSFTGVFAQSLYDESTIQTIEITFAESNWDALLDAEKAGDDGYIMAQSVSVNGVVFDSVGVKYKGNSTYNANQTKNPFHIELDTYKDQEYGDYVDIKLSNAAKDPSFIREVLSYQILRNYMDAPLSNFANVYVNGNLMGLYSNSEAISKRFVKNRFGSKTNTFVKCNPPAGAGPGSNDYPNLVYLGTDSTQYYDSYEIKSDAGWGELIDLCDELENDVASIEEILDVDRALWMLAFNNVFVNLDSYIGAFTQNYYLYRDDFGRFIPIVWDLNESFGTFSATGSGNLNNTTSKQQMDHLLHESDASFPLISQLLNIPTYKKMYLAHCKTLLEDNFTNNGPYYTQGQTLQTLVDADVQADQNKFYTYANFTSNLTTDVTAGGPGGSTPGITNLMNGRYTYLMGQSDFSATEPTISGISLSDDEPFLNDVIAVTADVVNEDVVYLRYRTAARAPFEKVQMFDDGQNNDGAANDGVFGAEMIVSSELTEYYIYAENGTIGKFSPTNAEHEFYSVSAKFETVGNVVINEFMASNSVSVADQDGEFDDWIELYNTGGSEVDLSGYHLSDDQNELAAYTFPFGTSIGGNSYLIVWTDDDPDQDGLHADFKLSSAGEAIYFSDANLNLLDAVTFPEQEEDISYGRIPNGTGPFEQMSFTFSSMNYPGVGLADLPQESSSFKVFPNPAQDAFQIEFEGDQPAQTSVNVYDMHSRLMHSTFMQGTTTVETSSWPAGLYVVVIGDLSIKLVKY